VANPRWLLMIGSPAWMLRFVSSRWSLCTKPEAAANLLVRENLPLPINPNQNQNLFRKSSQKVLFKATVHQRSPQQQFLRRNPYPQFLERLQSSKSRPLPISRKIANYSNQKNQACSPFRKKLRRQPRMMVLLSGLKVICQVVPVRR